MSRVIDLMKYSVVAPVLTFILFFGLYKNQVIAENELMVLNLKIQVINELTRGWKEKR